MIERDAAAEWLLQDAKSRGMTHSEYERQYGIILPRPNRRRGPAQRRIAEHEIAAGQMTDGDLAIARLIDRQRDDLTRSCVADLSASQRAQGSSTRSNAAPTP